MAFFLRRDISRRIAVVAAMSGAATLVCPSQADAFCRTTTALPTGYTPSSRTCYTQGLPLYWRGQCVGFSINREVTEHISLADATKVIDASFQTWSNVTCPSTNASVGISARDLGPVDCAEVRYNTDGPNQNVIVFRTTWPYNDPNNTLGLTTVTFNAENGEIYDADMEINASGKNLTVEDPVPATGYDLASVVTHEVGHFLGLAHATDPRATMYPSYKPGSTALRSLSADDIDGICTIYPNATQRSVATSVSANGVIDATPCDATPRHGFTTACAESKAGSSGCALSPSGPGASNVAELVVAALAVGVRTRRARRVR